MRSRYLVLLFVMFVLATGVAAAQTAQQRPAQPAEQPATPVATPKNVYQAPAQTAAQEPQPSPAASKASAPSGKVYRDLIRAGDYQGARVVVDEQKQATKTPTEAAGVSLNYANAMVRAYQQAPTKDPNVQREAARELDNVIRTGDVKQQLIARNNLAVMETARGDRASAIRVFEEGYETARSAPDAAVRSQFLFNYARTLEQGGGTPDRPDARNPASLYREAFSADPRMREAADAGFRLAVANRQLVEAAGFASMLIDKGHYSTADEALKSALSDAEIRALPEAPWLLVSAMNLVTREALSRKQFREQWGVFLRELKGMTPQASTTRDLMVMAHDKEPPAISGHFFESSQRKREAKRQLEIEWMAEAQLQHLSDYFTYAARVRVREAAASKAGSTAELLAAEALYTTGFYLRPENVDAAIGKATLLWDRREEIDADGLKMNYFIDELYAGKGDAYLGQDWSSIQRFHTVLGNIYYKRKQCGTRSDVRSALFQLHRAIESRRNLAQEQQRPVPGLYTMLAECYEIVKQPPSAYQAYQDAAREALLAQNASLALQVLDEKIPTVRNYEPTPDQVRSVAQLRARAVAAGQN
jgi:hypothetical protein